MARSLTYTLTLVIPKCSRGKFRNLALLVGDIVVMKSFTYNIKIEVIYQAYVQLNIQV